MNRVFLFAVKYRERFITLFKCIFVLLVGTTVIGGRSLYYNDNYAPLFYDLGGTAGKVAILLYCFTLIPGIARRFVIKNKLISILMIYRRYIGLAMFFTVLMHFWFMRGVDWFFRGIPFAPALFELFGITGGIILLCMAVTSNDWSTKRLGVWWGRIHSITYVLVWIIFLHVALQTLNEWAVLLGLTGTAVIISRLYSRLKTR